MVNRHTNRRNNVMKKRSCLKKISDNLFCVRTRKEIYYYTLRIAIRKLGEKKVVICPFQDLRISNYCEVLRILGVMLRYVERWGAKSRWDSAAKFHLSECSIKIFICFYLATRNTQQIKIGFSIFTEKSQKRKKMVREKWFLISFFCIQQV